MDVPNHFVTEKLKKHRDRQDLGVMEMHDFGFEGAHLFESFKRRKNTTQQSVLSLSQRDDRNSTVAVQVRRFGRSDNDAAKATLMSTQGFSVENPRVERVVDSSQMN